MHVQSLGQEDPQEEGMTIHSSYSCQESCMDREAWWAAVHGLQRVGHDWTDWPQYHTAVRLLGLPWWLSGKESTCNAGDACLNPGSERSPREGNGNPLQHSCLGSPMGAPVYGISRVEQDLVTKPPPPSRCNFNAHPYIHVFIPRLLTFHLPSMILDRGFCTKKRKPLVPHSY